MSTLQIVVPMAGRGSRFATAGYTTPKPLIPVGGRPMIQWVIENIRPQRPHQFTFICLAEHLKQYPEVPAELQRICPGCHIVPVNAVTEGAACTVLLAKEFINSADPLMIANSDQIVDLKIDEYLAAGDAPGVSGLIMTFWADHPKWSYCRLRPDHTVSEVVEKQVVSNEATVGIYNFRHGRDYVRAAETMIAKNLRVNGEFYVAPTYNQLIEEGAKVITVKTGEERNGMYGLGIPEDLDFFKTTEYYRQRCKKPLLHRAGTFFKLLTSRDPRDRIQLQRKLQALPSYAAFRSLLARIRQQSPADYVKMQKQAYELFASADAVEPGRIEGDYVVGSWVAHNEWPDYEAYLMRHVPRGANWVALEFGCGPGRNLLRWSHLFARIDGVDISKNNLLNARRFLAGALQTDRQPRLFETCGMDCGDAPPGQYDFAFSTICLQHICVHQVRFAIFKSLFASLKPGGRLSFQMGFGVPSPDTVEYFANHVQATGTNREWDVAVSSPEELKGDLERIGFVEFESWIRPVGPGDVHPNWIFVTALKPSL